MSRVGNLFFAVARCAVVVGGVSLVSIQANAASGVRAMASGSVEIRVSVAAKVAVRRSLQQGDGTAGRTAGRPCLASNASLSLLPVEMLRLEPTTVARTMISPDRPPAARPVLIGLCDTIAANPDWPDGVGPLLIRPE